ARRRRASAGKPGRASPSATSATIPGPDTSGLTSNLMHMTTHFPKRLLHPTPLRVATVTLCFMLGGCSVFGDWFSHGETDYKGSAKRTQPLEVPPDLTQLQKDSRYLPQGGVVTASDLNKPADAASAVAPAQIAAAPARPRPQKRPPPRRPLPPPRRSPRRPPRRRRKSRCPRWATCTSSTTAT